MKTVAILPGESEIAVGTTPEPTATIPPSRRGKKMISGHFNKTCIGS